MLRKLLLAAAAAIGGIYLTSDEGKDARAVLLEKKKSFDPVVKDLLKQLNEVFEGSKEVRSDEIRANVNFLIKEAKASLLEVELDKAISTIREAIAVASRKIREANDQMELDKSTINDAEHIGNK